MWMQETVINVRNMQTLVHTLTVLPPPCSIFSITGKHCSCRK